MAILKPTYYDGFQWYCTDNIFVKGYAFDENDHCYKGESLVRIFQQATDVVSLQALTASLNGLFCAMGKLPWGEFALVDKCRTFPLFYSNNGEKTVISDNPYSLGQSKVIREDSIPSYLANGYATGHRTLFEGIIPISASSILTTTKNQQSISEYFTFSTSALNEIPFDQAAMQLNTILDQAMQRMVKTLDNRPVAVPLSGGYDSRLILAWLVKYGYKNIVAFSYGKEGNPDALVAKEVAERLGVKWIPIYYSEELINGFTLDSDFLPFCHYMSVATSMPFLQDYFAARELVREKLIAPETIIIPGHSGDFIAGSHINTKTKSSWSANDMLNEIFNHHFTTNPITRKQAFAEKLQIKQSIENKKGIPFTLIENYNIQERQAKFIVNSTRAYSFFGFEYRLPLWDADLITFFKKTPFAYRLNKNLYDEVLQKNYFIPMQINIVNNDIQKRHKSGFDKIKNTIKGIVPICLLRLKSMPDYLNYGIITQALFKESNMPKPRNLGRSINAGITYWYLQAVRKTPIKETKEK